MNGPIARPDFWCPSGSSKHETQSVLSHYSLPRRQSSFNILLPSYIIPVCRATTLKDAAYSYRRHTHGNRSASTTYVTWRDTESTDRTMSSAPSVRSASGMPRMWSLAQHRHSALLLRRVLENHPPTPAASVCPLRPTIRLAGGHDLLTEPSMPTVPGTPTILSTRLDPLPLSLAPPGRHLFIQIPREAYPRTTTRATHDQCPTTGTRC